jgi:hypothetical protein
MQINNNEGLKATGYIRFDLFDENGNLKEHKEIKNVVVTVGKNYLATWLTAATQADYFMRYIALGTGAAAASASDTALGTELATRVAGTLTSSGAVWQNVATFGAGVNTGAITEAGIFSASSAGTMFARQTFGTITKAAGDSLQVTWQITIS